MLGGGARRVARDARPLSLAALISLAALVGVAVLVPLAGYPVGADVAPEARDLLPSASHWLGTDHLGRDVFWRLLLASRAFVFPGAAACLTAAVLAVPLGAWAGYRGGWSATVLRYGFTVLASLPRFVLVLLVCSIYGDAPWHLALAAGVAYAPTLAQAVDGRIEQLRSQEYLLASRAHGVPEWRLLWVHLIGAACGRLVGRHVLLLFGAFVVLECTLSYLGGFGVQEPLPSWGNMLVFEWGRGLAPAVVAPVLAIWCTVVATTLASEVFAEVDHG
jgi:ABC-type dipeptide/oligopeptide/nickel transport system permease subunit